jgi:hypothetical protein
MPISAERPSLVEGVQALRAETHQSVAYTGTAGVIANPVRSSIIRVVLTSAGFIKISPLGTAATTSDVYMAADSPEYFKVSPHRDKVSAIQSSAGGNLHVTEMS